MNIKTWRERAAENSILGITRDSKVAMEAEIDELRAALKAQPVQPAPLTDEQILADKILRYYFGLNGGAGPVSAKGKIIIRATEALVRTGGAG